MSAAAKCSACNDTGNLPMSNDLDCTHCGTAVERAAFDKWRDTLRSPGTWDDDWAIYCHGKAAGAAQAVPEGWRVVPVKPDDNMAYFGACSIINGIEQNRNESWAKEVRRVYTTMIHLAPEVP